MTENELLNRAEVYCSAAERCRCEVVLHLKDRKTGEVPDSGMQERILDSLERNGYLDERRYARAYVHDKFAFSGWGRIKIRIALAGKKIPSPIIDEALDVIDETEYSAKLRDLLAAKQRNVTARNDYERSVKLVRFAAQRGFEPELAMKILKM